MSPDLLTISVAIPTTYPTVNHLGRDGMRFGRKSPAYLEVFRAVREAAREEMERVGWTTATSFCEAWIWRYIPDGRVFDVANAGKVELDALAPSTEQQEKRDRCDPFPGVFANDRLVRPWHADVEIDAAGRDRIVIMVRRRHVPIVAKAHAPTKRVKKKVNCNCAAQPGPHYHPGNATPTTHFPTSNDVAKEVVDVQKPRYALVNGKRISYEEGVELALGKRP